MIATVNPATGETVRRFDAHTPAEVTARVGAAAACFEKYRRTSFADRTRWMIAAASLLETEREAVAAMMTTEMGKPITAAFGETDKCARACRFFAERAEGFLADEPADAGAVGAVRAWVRYEPLGPVLAVMPWNFPLWQAMRFAIPALMAGNVGLLKHASNVPQTALYMESLFARAGFPEGAFQTLLIGSDMVESVLRDPRVKAVTLTGSEPAGRAVAGLAGSLIKPSVMELGGSDPFIVMPSADIARAAAVAVTARTQNNGQSCIAAKRFIVHASVYEAFTALFVEGMQALRVGDPMDPATQIGPLYAAAGVDDVASLVADAVGKGATVLCGGAPLEGPGSYYPPTVVAGVTPAMRLHTEEAFAPVATLYEVGSIDEAIELANVTDFGLGSNAWTQDPAEQARFVQSIDAGAVFINGMTTSFPELPFGGIKHSGFGRELSVHGIRAFCNAKTVWLA